MIDQDTGNGSREAATVSTGDVEVRIREVGAALAGSFRRVLGELPGRPDRPGHLAEVLETT